MTPPSTFQTVEETLQREHPRRQGLPWYQLLILWTVFVLLLVSAAYTAGKIFGLFGVFADPGGFIDLDAMGNRGFFLGWAATIISVLTAWIHAQGTPADRNIKPLAGLLLLTPLGFLSFGSIFLLIPLLEGPSTTTTAVLFLLVPSFILLLFGSLLLQDHLCLGRLTPAAMGLLALCASLPLFMDPERTRNFAFAVFMWSTGPLVFGLISSFLLQPPSTIEGVKPIVRLGVGVLSFTTGTLLFVLSGWLSVIAVFG
jgi:hypothetical protein